MAYIYGSDETRTRGLRLDRALLYRLSYTPELYMEKARIELAASGLRHQRSTSVSYIPGRAGA